MASAVGRLLLAALGEDDPALQAALPAVLPRLEGIRERFDPDAHGGAHLLGIRGTVVVAHGSASRRGVANALRLAAEGAERGLVERIAGGLAVADGAHPAGAPSLGHTFADRDLLRRALTHRSHDPDDSNERLEFLGDAVLEFVITNHLYASSGRNEGEMTKVRISVVSQDGAQARWPRASGWGRRCCSTPGRRRPGAGASRRSWPTPSRRCWGRCTWTPAWKPPRGRDPGATGPRCSPSAARPRGTATPSPGCRRPWPAPGWCRPTPPRGRGPTTPGCSSPRSSAGGRILGSGTGTSKKAAEQAAARRALDLLAAEEAADA